VESIECYLCHRPIPIYNVYTLKQKWKKMQGICEPCYEKKKLEEAKRRKSKNAI